MIGNRSLHWGSLLEVAIALALLEAALWTLNQPQVVTGFVMLAWVMAATILSGRSTRELGISGTGFRAELWIVPAALGIGCLMVLGSGAAGLLHILYGARTPIWHAILYAVWALVQQFLTQSFIFVRLEDVTGSPRRAVLTTAAIFCLAHLPNPVLMPATFLMGLASSELFRRYRNIYPLAIAHAVLGLALAVSLPEAVTRHMRVGMAYWVR